jgi:hypothetical protein
LFFGIEKPEMVCQAVSDIVSKVDCSRSVGREKVKAMSFTDFHYVEGYFLLANNPMIVVKIQIAEFP